MKSKEVLNLISIANTYNQRPSTLAGDLDEYTAFCLDEACAFILNRVQNGGTPRFTKKYKSFKDLYKNYS